MQPITIIFELDDVLVKTQEVYDKAVTDVIDLIAASDVPVSDAYVQFKALEAAYTAQLGFLKERFPLSLVALYEQLAEKSDNLIDTDLKEVIYKRGYEVYNYHYAVLESTQELLSVLKYAGYKLLLVTKGDNDIQRTKAWKAEISSYFDETIVLANKTAKTWKFVADAYGIIPEGTFVVEANVADAKAASEVGFNAICFSNTEETGSKLIRQKNLEALVNFFEVENLFKLEKAYKSKPENNLIRAVADGYAVMVPHVKLKKEMPDCPGSLYLVVFEEQDRAFKEIHAVFAEDTTRKIQELSRVLIHWTDSEVKPQIIKERHANIPSQLCAACKNFEICKTQKIINGVKVLS